MDEGLPLRNPDSGLPYAEVSRRIEWSDTDASGHHHNSVVWRLTETCEAELFRQLGLLDDYFWSAPRVRQEVDYENKMYFGQGVTARVGVQKVGSASMTFWFEVWGDEYQGRPKRRSASGKFVTVHVPQGTEGSTPWSDEVRKAILG